MPKIDIDDIIVSAWNNFQSQDFEDSKKFLENLKKVLTKI